MTLLVPKILIPLQDDQNPVEMQCNMSGLIEQLVSTLKITNGFITGDWITIHIDFAMKRIVFYQNRVGLYTVTGEVLDEDCYFWMFVDRPEEALFIENAPTLRL